MYMRLINMVGLVKVLQDMTKLKIKKAIQV